MMASDDFKKKLVVAEEEQNKDEETKLGAADSRGSAKKEPLLRAPEEPGTSSPQPDASRLAARRSSEIHRRELAADMAGIIKSASTDKFDHKQGFYDDTEASVSRHHLEDIDISQHHRTGEFPHAHTSFSLKRKGHTPKHHISKHSVKKKDKKTEPEAQIPDPDEGSNTELREIFSAPELQTIGEDDPKSCDVEPTRVPGESRVSVTFSENDVTDHRLDVKAPMPATSTPRMDVDLPDVAINVEDDDDVSSRNAQFYLGSESTFPDRKPSTSNFLSEISTDIEPSPSAIEIRSAEHTSSVRFQIGDEVFETSPSELKKPKKSGKKHHHHHHPKPHLSINASAVELGKRRYIGSEVKLDERLQRIATDEDEARQLGDADLAEIASHRLVDPRGMRHRKISKRSAMASVVHIGQQKTRTPPKNKYDHKPHEMFVELDELHIGEDEEWVWEEKARWIKFEEDLEEGADRWGKPHVASLSFHSLLELRKGLEQGAILLDLTAEDLPGIATSIVDELVMKDQLHPEEKGAVLKALLLKHKHVNERLGLRRNLTLPFLDGNESNGSPRFNKYRKLPTSPSFGQFGSSKSLDKKDSAKSLDKKESVKSLDKKDSVNSAKPGSRGSVDLNHSIPDVQFTPVDATSSNGSAPETPRTIPKNQSTILKRIPEGSESTTVLIGAVDFLKKPIMAFVRLSEGRHLGNLTEVPLPVRFVFLLMGPREAGIDYHEIGRSISTLMANTSFHDEAYHADDRGDLLDSINEFLDDSIVLPPGDWDKRTLLPIMDMARERSKAKLVKKQKKEPGVPDKEPPKDPLQRTGRIFGGLINDVRARYPKYLSDIRDCLNLQCLTTFFFIYFACFAPAITFGGLLREKTYHLVGVTETLVGTSVFGMLFALFSAQPLMIIGVTGPVNVFDEGLYKICDAMGLEYLAVRVWVGFWITIYAFFIVMFDGTFLVRYFTRFVEEIFASLISLIFIYEALARINKEFGKEYYIDLGMNATELEAMFVDVYENRNFTSGDPPDFSGVVANISQIILTPLNHMYGYPNSALLSMILIFGTFLIAFFLKKLRNSKFLGRPIRRAIGDFGVPISITIMVLIDFFFIHDKHTEKLDMPSGISVSNPNERGWLINPLGVNRPIPIWAPFFASILAMLVFILIFMETEITSMIVNKKDRNLVKGSGYYMDLMLVGLFGSFSGLFGVPFLCSATVRTVSHVSALSIYSKTHAPGEKPKLLGAHEQRVTGFAVHLMIGLSILMGPLLRQIPVAVLFGVFLYMGVASMSGIQFLDRVQMLFKPVKHHLNVKYVRRVRTVKMHMFTVIQLLALGILWAIKSTAAALAFPFILLLLVPVRLFILRFLFTPQELECLDNEEEADNDSDDDEPDFYTQVHMPM